MDKISLAAYLSVILFFLGKVWEVATGKAKKTEGLMEKNTEAINKLIVEMAETRIELRHVKDALKAIPEMEKDLNAAHSAIRELKATTN